MTRVRLATALGVLLTLLLAAPVRAQETGSTVTTFDAAPDARVFTAQCTLVRSASGGRDGGAFLRVPCGSMQIVLPAPQRIVELFVQAPAAASLTVEACDATGCDGSSIAQQVFTAGPQSWAPVVLSDPTGASRIVSVRVFAQGVSSAGPSFDLDDVTWSALDEPRAGLTSYAYTVSGAPATFALRTSSPLGGTYDCILDGTPVICASPFTTGPLAEGTHTFSFTTRDVYGRVSAPATQSFFLPPSKVPPPAPADRDRDGVPDTLDNCLATANSDQADADADGVGNACEVLPAGDVPPVAGVNSVVKLLSGEVYVKLPTRTALGLRGLRVPFQESGFVPLKGVASVPVGSTVDARKGEVAVEAAANGYAPQSRRARTQQARLKAALFTMRQARRRKTATAATSIPTDIGLVSPPGAEAACQSGPAKGVVRSLSMVAKGYFRALGGASTATARNATFNTTDRCDGTLTQVGRGSVKLAVKGAARRVTVRAGQAYLIRARLFRARKGIGRS